MFGFNEGGDGSVRSRTRRGVLAPLTRRRAHAMMLDGRPTHQAAAAPSRCLAFDADGTATLLSQARGDPTRMSASTRRQGEGRAREAPGPARAYAGGPWKRRRPARHPAARAGRLTGGRLRRRLLRVRRSRGAAACQLLAGPTVQFPDFTDEVQEIVGHDEHGVRRSTVRDIRIVLIVAGSPHEASPLLIRHWCSVRIAALWCCARWRPDAPRGEVSREVGAAHGAAGRIAGYPVPGAG